MGWKENEAPKGPRPDVRPRPQPVATHEITGADFEVVHRLIPHKGSGAHVWGRCYHDSRKIMIAKQLQGQDHCEAVIHEVMHAAMGQGATEQSITDAAEAAASLLWELGYRRLPKRQRNT